VGAVHPILKENSYDVILDGLLESRRDTSRRIFVSSEITASDFAEALSARSKGQSVERLLHDIDHSGYLGLEEFVRDRLLVQGFDANLTKRSGDGGADIVVRDELGRILYLVQCKHTNDIDQPVDGGLVLDAQRVRANWQAASAAVIGISNAKKFAPRVLDGFYRIGGRLIARDELAGFTLL
jgi:HJR/Mrr/RecB family endonuclease